MGGSAELAFSGWQLTELKIDRTFVQPVVEDAQQRVLVKTVVSLAKAFGLTTVAEGVETQEQLDFLWQAGCEQSQGYLHSKPVPAAQLVEILGRGKGSMPAETTRS